MPHDHETIPGHPPGRAAAHNSYAAGISVPATTPHQLLKEGGPASAAPFVLQKASVSGQPAPGRFVLQQGSMNGGQPVTQTAPFRLKGDHAAQSIIQRKKIPFNGEDGEQLDTEEPHKITNYVIALLKQGNNQEVDRLLLHLTTASDRASDYEGLNQAQYVARSIKQLVTAWQIKRQTPEPVPQQTAPEIVPVDDGPVLNALKTRNVILAGETHGMEGVEGKEKQVWGEKGIQVVYENGVIKTGEGAVSPDPGALRILYFMEQFYEALLAYKRGEGGAKGLMDVAYEKCIKEHGDYTPKQIETGLVYKGKPIMSYERLIEYKTIMYETLELADKHEQDREKFFGLQEVRGPADEMLGLMDDIKEAAGRDAEDTSPIMRELRSDVMYNSIINDLHPGGKTIYKVGNNHVLDIAKKVDLRTINWIFKQEDYLAELDRLWKAGTK
ncbi:hypothetical protein SAMN04488505_108178 [Chitinophaga rupis]|uniref:Uncharacterized protein n=1 Tax=Chitinophaga rupis TaxID=573321 RepID=A0A1H8E3N8_9BACT|nr:hypothetical protein [Chitinophaga rupis]SEN14045.1 hypothetical protein SAMN04488505_108178 [Chitinophaga rupis]